MDLDRRVVRWGDPYPASFEYSPVEPLDIRHALEMLFYSEGQWAVSTVEIGFADGDVFEYSRFVQ